MSIRIKGGRITRDNLDGLFNEYYPRIYNYLYYRTLNVAVSDDLVSEVMVNVVRRFDTFDANKGNLDGWMFRIAHNVLMSYFRKNRAVTDIDDVPEGVFASADDDPLDDKDMQVRELLKLLTDEERELVYLKYWEELSNKEIAERLDLNPSTVSTKLWRANEKMKRAID